MIELNDPSLLRQSALIDGQWVPAGSGKTLDVTNPATGLSIGTVPDMDELDTRAAIDAANAAYAGWKSKTAAERAERLEAWHALMLAHIDDLAVILTLEQGKPLSEARGEIAYGASFVK